MPVGATCPDARKDKHLQVALGQVLTEPSAYGSHKVTMVLGFQVNGERVRGLLAELGLQDLQPKAKRSTTTYKSMQHSCIF
jgi:hypothetical protein